MSETKNEADVAFIQALAALLRENDLTELEVKREHGEDDSLKVRVSRMQPQPVVHHVQAAPLAPAAATPAVAAATSAAVAPAPSDPAALPGALTSPMVGTCYLAPEPGADPFVKIGDRVTEGQTVLIIEAMKTMNQIPAHRAGVVQRILVEDATPVEYGAPLLVIE